MTSDQRLNPYGDSLVKTTGTHGADIAIQRMDDLDREALRFALHEKNECDTAIDLGCGTGIQGLRIASYGIKTILIDLMPRDMTVMRLNGIEKMLPISYLEKDARTLQATDLPHDVHLCYSQRFIHYLTFNEAMSLLKLVRSRMHQHAKLFLSASGLLSELGRQYPAYHRPVDERFSVLAPEMAEKHQIHEPVCLYTKEDLIALCEAAAFVPSQVFSSSFGNVKGIFSPV